MSRTIVQVAKVRLMDLEVGDVINAEPDALKGWFTVEDIRRLPSGELNATGAGTRHSVMGSDHDMVGVQATKIVAGPAQSTVASAA